MVAAGVPAPTSPPSPASWRVIAAARRSQASFWYARSPTAVSIALLQRQCDGLLSDALVDVLVLGPVLFACRPNRSARLAFARQTRGACLKLWWRPASSTRSGTRVSLTPTPWLPRRAGGTAQRPRPLPLVPDHGRRGDHRRQRTRADGRSLAPVRRACCRKQPRVRGCPRRQDCLAAPNRFGCRVAGKQQPFQDEGRAVIYGVPRTLRSTLGSARCAARAQAP